MYVTVIAGSTSQPRPFRLVLVLSCPNPSNTVSTDPPYNHPIGGTVSTPESSQPDTNPKGLFSFVAAHLVCRIS